MDPLSAAASIIAVLQLSAKVLAYLNDVKDASKDRAQCAIEASNLHNLLLNLRFRLEEGGSEPWCTAVRALSVENGPLDQFKQALEMLATKMTEGGRLKKASEALVWKFKREEITSILDRMERLKTLIEIALQMDHFKLSHAIKDDTNFVRTHIPAIQSGVDRIWQEQDYARHSRVLEWISPTDYPAQQSDIIKRRQEGTGQWFLDALEVKKWLSEAKGTLFCPGIPGAGKTMVAAIAIDHLLKSVQNNSNGVAYVFCNYKAREEQDATSMLTAILKQLVQARPSISIVEPVEQLHRQHADKGTRPSLNEVYSTLRDVLANFSTVYIVIDALDECQDDARHQFLAKLQDLQAGRDLRLMATSRFIPEIVDVFREALRLEVQASDEDVKRFVAGQTYRMPKRIQRDSALLNMIQDKIVEAVDGMFLLARLHTDSLLDKRTPKDVKLALSRFLKGSVALNDAYKDAIIRIEGQPNGDFKLAQKVLSWITYAKRPLTTAELCCALAVEPEEAELDLENIPDVEDLVSVCAGLVVVDQESAVIRLVHYTTQEYFERIIDAWDPGSRTCIATTCLTYLSFHRFKSGSCSTDEEFEERLQENKFLDYAAKHWAEHTRAVEAELSSLACSFLLESGLLLCATQVLAFDGLQYRDYSQVFAVGTGLHCTARFGLSQITQELLPLLQDGATNAINATDSWGQAALSLAAEHGHDEMAKLLVKEGADVNAQGGDYGNALQSAAAGGYKEIVELLVKEGAEVNEQGGDYGNALQSAAAGGYKEIVELLVKEGAEVNAQGGHYGNALRAAAAEGHKEVVELLVKEGAEVNAQGGHYGNALQSAAAGGYKEIVELLVTEGAEVNVQGGYYSNALQAAAARGYKEVVELLVKEGAKEEVVKLLLNKGVEEEDGVEVE